MKGVLSNNFVLFVFQYFTKLLEINLPEISKMTFEIPVSKNENFFQEITRLVPRLLLAQND